MRETVKKTSCGILAAAIVLSAGITGVFAADKICGRNFKDADGDGVCDYAKNNCAYTDLDGDGVCDNFSAGRAIGQCRGLGKGYNKQGKNQCGANRQ